MRFEHEGKHYRLEFQRDKRKLTRPFCPEVSTYPYTTARLLEIGADGKSTEPIASGTVGYWHQETEPFSHERGRQLAMKKLTANLQEKGISNSVIALMWKTYHERKQPQTKVIQGEIVQ